MEIYKRISEKPKTEEVRDFYDTARLFEERNNRTKIRIRQEDRDKR